MIIDLLSFEIHQFLEEIEKLGFSLCLVGGITRDYFLTKKLGKDFDIEIRSSIVLDNPTSNWPLYYKKLHRYLDEKKLNFIELPYLITRVEFNDKSFEFSSPRSEVAIPGNCTHHYFEALLDPALSYEASFKRRDFTINSIGIELNFKALPNETIIDPNNGLEDLKNKVLRNTSDDFYLDPVRFLRLIRFQCKLRDFTVAENLLSHLNLFKLSELSIHYFNEELFKTYPGEFLNLFSHFVLLLKLKIPDAFLFWTKYIFPSQFLSKEEILAYVFLKDESDAQKVLEFFSMPEKKLKELKSFMKSYEAVLKMDTKKLLDILALPFEEGLNHELFKDLKNLEEKKQWQFVLNLRDDKTKLLISWSDWRDIPVNASDFNALNPSLRSYYKYFMALKKIYSK